jgi:GAF domain-containing protein
MVTPPDETTADLHDVIVALRAQLDAALAEKAELTKALAERNDGERVGHQASIVDNETLKAENEELRAAQAAGLEVLHAMVASPGDSQPVFDLIAQQAAKLCQVPIAAVAIFDGAMVRLVSQSGFDAAYTEVFAKQFPRVPSPNFAMGRAILSRRVEQIEDTGADDRVGFTPPPGPGSALAVPLLRNGAPLGVIAVGRRVSGAYSKDQITLLQTFAEQAVVAITSTETFQELEARTTALAQRNSEYGERIEHQSATIDVLQAMAASPGDPQPVFDLIARHANELCNGTGCGIFEFDGSMVHNRTSHFGAVFNESAVAEYLKLFPMVPTQGSFTCRAILSKQIVHITDTRADSVALPVVKALGYGSQLSIPLMRDSVAIGAISLGGALGGFSDSQIALLRTFAEQAVIAITSAETYRALQTRTSDLQEALEQQTATAEVLQVINASPGDLAPVFEAMLDKAMHLCEAKFGAIGTFDGERIKHAVFRGVPAAYSDYAMNHPLSDAPETVIGRIRRGETIVHIQDLMAEAAYRDGHPDRLALVELGGARTGLGVALRKDNTVLGMMSFYRQEVRPFSDRQLALLENFAAQAVIAMENARLITETREALEQQTATAEVLQVINSSPGNLAPVFEAMLDKALDLCGAAFGTLWTRDGECFRPVALRRVPAAYAELLSEAPYRPEPGSQHERLLLGAPYAETEDVAAEAGIGPVRRALVELGGARTVIAVPLLKDGAVLGVISAYRQEVRPFSDKQIALLQNFAAQAVIAMENARLITETREALEQQTATAEVLQVINQSPGNLEPVFEAILNKAHTLCGVSLGSLASYDGKLFHRLAMHGYPPEYEALIRLPNKPRAYGQRLLDGARFVHVADLAEATPSLDEPLARAAVDIAGVRTALWVPLRKDGRLLGYFNAQRREVRPYSDNEVTLLENFAAQAVIAMENARLITETREALAQQTAVAEVLQVINSSPGNLTPVFDAMLEKAMRLCGAAFGLLYTYDGELVHTVAHRGVPAALAEFRVRHPPSARPGGSAAPLFETKRTIHILDMMDQEFYRAGDAINRATVDLGGARTTLTVPLLRDDAVIGAISIYRQDVRAFSPEQIALLENFAAQAVIAMENARLITETREALEQQTATAEVLQVINSSPGDLAPVFDAMLDRALLLCEASFGSLMTYDGEFFNAVAGRGEDVGEWVPEQGRQIRPEPGTTVSRILKGEDVVHVADITQDEEAQGTSRIRRAMIDRGFRTLLTVALRRDRRLLGAINIFRREIRPFTDKQIALLQNFAAQAVIATENARLLYEIRQRQQELRVTFDNMIDGVAMFDEALHLAAWNRNFQELLQLPDELLAQRRDFDTYIRYLVERGEFGATDPETQIARLRARIGDHYNFERTRPDGTVIEIRNNPMPDGGVVVIYSDITERKRSEAEIRAARDAAEAAYRDLKAAQASLIQAEKMASLGQLTAGIAHEIKNPLNFVNNFAELSGDLLDELHDAVATNQQAEIDELTATLKSNLAKIAEHGRRADGIVRSMLEHSRGSSGERRSVNLNTLVDEALNLAYHGARARDQSFNITLERDFAEGITPITLVPQDITRVLLNLLSNGFYAARRRQSMETTPGFEPTLSVATRELGDAVEIRVRDNGIGIPEEVRDKLFQPFFTTKPTGEGTGLGLSISYDIITQQHGGNITVESKVGEHSEFTIRLPRNS